MFAQYPNLEHPSVPVGPAMQPGWLLMHGGHHEYMIHANDVFQGPHYIFFEPVNYVFEPIRPFVFDSTPTFGEQEAFRKLHPLRTPLLPEQSERRPTLVLDLDETLIHTTFDHPPEHQEFTSLYVNHRPWVRSFLKCVSEWYEVVIYTASLSAYANSILDTLDPKNEIFSHRLYREHCAFFQGVYIKDIEALGRSMKKTVFIDNFPGAYMMQPLNALPVRSFVGNTDDNELFQVMKLLKILRHKDDFRPLLRRYQNHWKNIHFHDDQAEPGMEN